MAGEWVLDGRGRDVDTVGKKRGVCGGRGEMHVLVNDYQGTSQGHLIFM